MWDQRILVTMLRDENRARSGFLHRLYSTPIENAIVSGDVLGPLRRVDGPGRFDWLEACTYYSRFRKADRVQLMVGTGGGHAEPYCELEVKDVVYPAPGRIRLQVTRKRTGAPVPGVDYFMYPAESKFVNDRLYECIAEAGTGHAEARKPAFFRAASHKAAAYERLNRTQKNAFDYLVDLSGDGCVQGPPGTGKTQLLKAIIEAAVGAGLRVGLTAFTHKAVDNALSRLVDLPTSGGFARIGNKMKIDESMFPVTWLNLHRYDSFKYAPPETTLYAATSHSWIMSPSRPKVDLLVIDEAAQLPVYMVPPLLKCCGQVICLGDHKQLPPVLKGSHESLPHVDLFSYFLSTSTPMLELQYRMNEEIQSWSSERYYESKLKAHGSNARRDVLRLGAQRAAELGQHPVQLLTHPHRCEMQANVGEARLVADRVEQILRSGALEPVGLGVIAPHRMQNGAICCALQEKLGLEVAIQIVVDTVERFQGQEREVIVFSFGSDSERGAAKEGKENFLGDPKRINVSVTRARSRFYCLAPQALVESSRLRQWKASGSELGDFFRWLGSEQKVSREEEDFIEVTA
ncbi:MAG: AAA family ATPase [Armatimonadetes bacterium]|nr:AAA family ATPase [Armatimonadota bacterium]